MFDNPGNAPLQLINEEEIKHFGVKLYIKREDLIHPEISGNKWRKLKYNFIEAQRLGLKRILTFGGAYSNHISATAAAGKQVGFETIGIIRGEEASKPNPTLSAAFKNGMILKYWTREKYRQGLSKGNLIDLVQEFREFYLIPEGGTNVLAVDGTKEIIEDINIPFDYICCPVGTGGTLAGLIKSNKTNQAHILGFSALKKGDFLEGIINELSLNNSHKWKIINDYSFRGYAKFNSSLIEFVNSFYIKHKIELDPIYTGKMMFGIFDLIQKGFFPKGSIIIAIHTGGIQGKKGFNERFGNILL